MQKYIEMIQSIKLPPRTPENGLVRMFSLLAQIESYGKAHEVVTTLKQDYPEYREYEAFDPGISEEELEAELEEELGNTDRQDQIELE